MHHFWVIWCLFHWPSEDDSTNIYVKQDYAHRYQPSRCLLYNRNAETPYTRIEQLHVPSNSNPY